MLSENRKLKCKYLKKAEECFNRGVLMDPTRMRILESFMNDDDLFRILKQ